MAMLLGEFRCGADGEGRVTIPSSLRGELIDGATVTRGIERCLLVYPSVEWEKLTGKIEERLPFTSQSARSFARFIFSGAQTCVPDRTGQVFLPDRLREYAGIEDEVIIVGLLSHLEVWCPEQWQETKSTLLEDGPALAQELRDLGI